MADRTSAGIFATQFERLAKKEKSSERDETAREIWADTWCYDFSACQMDCPKALLELGLAKIQREDDYDFYVYRNRDCSGWDT